MDTLALFLQEKELTVGTLLLLLRIASIDTTHFQRVISILLSTNNASSDLTSSSDSTNNDKDNNNNNNTSSQQHIQLTTLQRLAVFQASISPYIPIIPRDPISRDILNGIQLDPDQYFEYCERRIEERKINSFGILRIIDLVNPSTVDLVIQSLKLIDPSDAFERAGGEAFKYILHINSQQWREIKRKEELLNGLEALKRRFPDSKKWRIEKDFSLMNQAIIKLSLLVGGE